MRLAFVFLILGSSISLHAMQLQPVSPCALGDSVNTPIMSTDHHAVPCLGIANQLPTLEQLLASGLGQAIAVGNLSAVRRTFESVGGWRGWLRWLLIDEERELLWAMSSLNYAMKLPHAKTGLIVEYLWDRVKRGARDDRELLQFQLEAKAPSLILEGFKNEHHEVATDIIKSCGISANGGIYRALHHAIKTKNLSLMLALLKQDATCNSNLLIGEIAQNNESLLVNMVQLLTKLDQLLQLNGSIQKLQDNQAVALNPIYIPRAYQPYVNEKLSKLSNQEIAALYNAADFLDIPFALNAIAAVIADRIHPQIDIYWNTFTLTQRNELVADALTSWNIFNKHEYIVKQVTLRKNGITQEYSIADYLAKYGQPTLIASNVIRLDGEGLTSLFGLDMLQEKEKIEVLWLNNNCFFDLSLDLQPGAFDGLHALKRLFLGGSKLINLQPGVFDGLYALQDLSLNNNWLTNLLSGTFNELQALEILGLENNRLTNLQPGVFKGLQALRALILHHNKLANIQPETFNELQALEQLGLSHNQLINLHQRVFDGLLALEGLHLSYNQLTNLQLETFKKLQKLKVLSLNNNKLIDLQSRTSNGLQVLEMQRKILDVLPKLNELYLHP